MGQQGQRDVAIPALPSAHLILIESAFAFGRLEAGLDFPPAARDVHQGLPCGLAARRGFVKLMTVPGKMTG
ncbi:hypothetical protein B0G82_7796 [Paraburkholderia sp. BL17N1]|nr:hypothetical protein B0G82_7796 [Paraburkholderia sp. BL17N1]